MELELEELAARLGQVVEVHDTTTAASVTYGACNSRRESTGSSSTR